MEELYIELSARSPLAIRSDHAPGGAATAGYISGTTFIGALAAAHRLLRPHDTGDFERWFLSQQILYPNLYPASSSIPVYKNEETFPSIHCQRRRRVANVTRDFSFLKTQTMTRTVYVTG